MAIQTLISVIAVIFFSAACAAPSNAPQVASDPAVSAPKRFASNTDVFVALQVAGARADYPSFAAILDRSSSTKIVQELNRSFGGAAFESNTSRASTRTDQHNRSIVLSAGGASRLLEVEMQKGTDGWMVTDYTFSSAN